MKRVVGFGGIFFKAEKPAELSAWYKRHLGLDVDEWGATFREPDARNTDPKRDAYTLWAPFDADTEYFAPSAKPFMFNFRVHDLDSLLRVLRDEGVPVDDKREDSELGKFGWVMDPEGNRVELWEPPIAK
jgi:catechol 2,3-dioxygenase-like lactoylglutathione lyase family enzyme